MVAARWRSRACGVGRGDCAPAARSLRSTAGRAGQPGSWRRVRAPFAGRRGVKAHSSRYVEVRLKRIDLERGGRPVLREIAWTVKPGERWVLAGGNGAGKTQLLKLVSGAVWPTPTGRESRKYGWNGETWPTPADVKDEIAYVGPERQDKYERYGWNHTVTQVVGTGLYR